MAYNKDKSKDSGRVDVRKRGPKVDSKQTVKEPAGLPLNSLPDNGIGSISTGIRSGLTSLTLQGTTTDYHYNPYYSYNYSLNVVGEENSYTRHVLDSIVYPLYKNTLQAAINYNIDLTDDSFRDYFTRVSRALAAYFTIDSVRAYCKNPNTQNIALEYLRQSIDSSTELQMNLLKERLQACVLPPNMVNLIYWLHQHYVHTNMPGTPILKMCHGGLWMYGQADDYTSDQKLGNVSETTLEAILDDLLDLTTSNLGSIMTQVFKPWVISEIPDCMPAPLFDPNWLTLWSNLGIYAKTSGTGGHVSLPTSATADTTSSYVSFANQLDGAVVALSNNQVYSGYKSEENWGSGIIIPFQAFSSTNVNVSNRCRFNSVTELIITNNEIPHAVNAGQFHAVTWNASNVPSDTDCYPCWAVVVHDFSLSRQYQSIEELVRFMYHADQLNR